jgi:hypothetical protein
LLNTHSSFRYGHNVTNENLFFPIDEGSGEIQVALKPGAYTLTDFATELARALNEFSEIENNYETSVDYETGFITISGDSAFDILLGTSSILAISVFSLAGFTGSLDLTGASSYESDSRSGSIYYTQFKIQGFVSLEEQESLAQASINIPATGSFEEVISYGLERIAEGKFTYITNIFQAEGAPIRNRPNGKAEFIDLLRALTRKYPVEFCPDESDQLTFNKLILSSASGDSKGTGYKLKELTSRSLSNYFEIDLKFRELRGVV